MKNFNHYKRGYYMPPVQSTNWVNKEYVDKAPIWCSVDLRDGNQALVTPMNLDEKLKRLENGAARLGIEIIGTRAMDARVFDPALEAAFNLVIADVPCSGLGVIARKPEIRGKDPAELAGLPVIQSAILENLSRYVKPGGTLLYSTCTILKEENEDVALRFLKTHEDYRAEAFSCCGITSDSGMYTFWPNIDGTDGFFAAKFKRTV